MIGAVTPAHPAGPRSDLLANDTENQGPRDIKVQDPHEGGRDTCTSSSEAEENWLSYKYFTCFGAFSGNLPLIDDVFM